jgi:hypothetical protein
LFRGFAVEVVKESKVFDGAFSTKWNVVGDPVVVVDDDVRVLGHGSDFGVVAIEGTKFFKGNGEAKNIGK